MEKQTATTDILRLFREDIEPSDRVHAFELAAEQIRDEVQSLATPENIEQINSDFSMELVLNTHMDGVDAGQSVRAVGNKPYLTFVENASDADIADNYLFDTSIKNAFVTDFNDENPFEPIYKPEGEKAWGYWRDRGLLAKGSLIAPIDIRHYSRRLLDALMGDDYDQGFLHTFIGEQELNDSSFEDLVESQISQGKLIMLSNAVREWTSAKQILDTLLLCSDSANSTIAMQQDSKDKLVAVTNKRKAEQDKLPVNVIYGTGHHSFIHVLRNVGLEVGRTFPGKDDLPGSYKFIGAIKDQFFGSHHFELSEEKSREYAVQRVLEGVLIAPLGNHDYGYVLEDRRQTPLDLHRLIAKSARDPELVENAEDIFESFKSDPTVGIEILQAAGARLRSINE